MCNVLYSLHPSIARTTYSLYPLQLFCFGHRLVRAPGPHLYKDDFSCTYISNLNLLGSPWTSLSHRTTLESTLPLKTLDIVLRNRPLLRLLRKPPAPVSFEEALQSSPSPPCSSKTSFEESLSNTVLRVYVCLYPSQAYQKIQVHLDGAIIVIVSHHFATTHSKPSLVLAKTDRKSVV